MQQRSIETRTRILEAAARLFAARGYRSASLAAIGAAAGVTTGAVYFHFDSKTSVAHAVIELQHEITSARAMAIMSAGHSAIDTLTHLSASLGRDIMLDPVVRAGTALTTDLVLFPEPYRKPWEDWFAMLSHLFAAGIAEGDVDPAVDVEALSRLIGPAFAGIQLVSGIMNGHADLLARLRDLSTSLIPAFAAAGQAERLLADAIRVFAEYEAEVSAAAIAS